MANYVVLPESTQEYGCPECDENHSMKEDAQRCCKDAQEGYQCDNCGAAFRHEEEAATCCPQYSDCYLCPGCETSYDVTSDAIACCSQNIEVRKYKCVIDGYAWTTREEAVQCCSHVDPHGVEVAFEHEHGRNCVCRDCQAATGRRDVGLETAPARDRMGRFISATTTASTLTVEFDAPKQEEAKDVPWPPREPRRHRSAFA